MDLNIYLNDQIIFPSLQSSIINTKKLLKNKKRLNSKKHRIVFTGIENIKQDLKNYSISLFKRLINLFNPEDPLHSEIIKIYIYFNNNFSREKFWEIVIYFKPKRIKFSR